MIDLELRQRLSQDLRQLVTGRISNAEFDEVYHELYWDSTDIAVREISRFCWSLYSDPPGTYWLRGIHAVAPATRKQAAYAILFLRTEYEYTYPEHLEHPAEALTGCVWWTVVAVGIAGLVSSKVQVVGPCVIIGLAVVVLGILTSRVRKSSFIAQCVANGGDMQIWPFSDRESLAPADQSAHLLSNSKPITTACFTSP